MGAASGRMDVQVDERRFDLKETMARQMRMGGKPNPLSKHFENDRVVMQLQLDNKDRFDKAKFQACAQFAPIFAMPCFWPHLMILGGLASCCGMPCDYCLYGEERLNKIGDAHKLVLRENSLHYVVETHLQAPICMPICCHLLGGTGQTIDRFEEVYPISMISWSGVVPAVKVCTGSGPDTCIVKVNDGTLPSVAIDAPANGEEFIKTLEKMKAAVAEESAGGGAPGADLPPDVLQEFQQYLMTTSAYGGMVGAMMMNQPGGGVGVQQQQQQAQAQAALMMAASAAPQHMMMQRMLLAQAQVTPEVQAMAQAQAQAQMQMMAHGQAPVAMMALPAAVVAADAGVSIATGVAVPVAVAAAPAGREVATAAAAVAAERTVAPQLQGYSVDEVVNALTKQLNLGQYAERFRAEGIDGRCLADLDEQTLEVDLGVGSGLHRKKILRWVRDGY